MNNRIPLLIVASIILPISIYAQSTISLRRSFIDSFKNKVTITADYDVWYTHHKAKPATQDGDIHCSGYDDKIGMPTVAEIMNAKRQQEAIDVLIDNEGKGKTGNTKVSVTGVLRLWPEHMGKGSKFFQGMKLTKAKIQRKTTNPDHVFEIHPLTEIEGIDLTGTITNVEGYEAHDAKKAIGKIEQKECMISSDRKTISFSTSMIGFNYIDLWIQIDSSWEVEDGAFAYCTLLSSSFTPGKSVKANTLAKHIRVVFIKDTEVYNELVTKSKGDFIHILGTPRVNLAVLEWREWVSKERPEVLSWNLPYEMVADGLIE